MVRVNDTFFFVCKGLFILDEDLRVTDLAQQESTVYVDVEWNCYWAGS